MILYLIMLMCTERVGRNWHMLPNLLPGQLACLALPVIDIEYIHAYMHLYMYVLRLFVNRIAGRWYIS